MTINEAKEIIFSAQLAAYPNEKNAKTLGKLWTILDELEKYRNTGLSPEDCAEYKKFEDEIIKSGKTFRRIIELIQADKEGDFNDTPHTT